MWISVTEWAKGRDGRSSVTWSPSLSSSFAFFFFGRGEIPLSGTQVIPLVVFSFCVHVSNPGWDRDPAATAQVQASGVGSPFQRVLLSSLLEDGVYCWGHTDAEWVLECGRTSADNTEGFFFSADRWGKKKSQIEVKRFFKMHLPKQKCGGSFRK